MGYERIDGRDPVEVRITAVETDVAAVTVDVAEVFAETEVIDHHFHNRER